MPALPVTDELRAAEAAYAAGRFADAATLFAQLSTDRPDELRLQLRLGQLALYDNRLDAAARAFTRCAEGSGTAVELLAETYYRARRFVEAAHCYAQLGEYEMAAHLRSFCAREPCRIEGPAATAVEFLTRHPLPLLRVQVNDSEEALFVFDTGAWDSVIDAGLAHRLGLPRGRPGQVGCADGRNARVEYSRLDSIGIGALRIADVPVQVMDLGQALAGFFEPHGVDGVLGLGALSRLRISLDMPAAELRLARAADGAVPGMPCWLGGGRQLLAWGEINRHPILWFVDTGMTGFDCLVPATTAINAGLALAPSQLATGYGGGGQATFATADIAGLRLDTLHRSAARGVVTPAFPLERCYGFRIGGLLAFEFFRRAVLDIDLMAMRVAVRAAD